MALNFGPPVMNFEALGSLGKTFQDAQAAAQKRLVDDQRRQLLASLGQGSGDFQKAGLGLIGAGDVQSGVALLGLAQKDREQKLQEEAYKTSPFSSSAAPKSPGAPVAAIGNPNEVESRFIGGVKQAGLVNPVGLAAVAAYGNAESGFSPRNVNRTWNDPSESGQSGQAGGILSWRADRLQKLQSFAAQRGEQGNGSPETQAAFLAQEDPTLIPRLNAAKTPQEANQIMASAWRFAGYNREGGENARRLALTQQYAGRFGAGGGQASATVPLGSPPQPVQVAENEADVQRLEAQMPGYGGQAPVGAGGVYAGVDDATLNGYLNNPRVPPNLKALVQQELASRRGGGAPVQVAQAPAQAGAPVADAPAPGAQPVQGFAVPPGEAGKLPPNDPFPQVTNEQLVQVIRNPRSSPGDKALAQQLFASRQAYASETAPEKREQTRLETRKKDLEVQKLEREVSGVLTPEQEAQKIRLARAGRAVNEAPIPPGYRAVRDAEGNLERVEPIPGSKQEREAKDLQEKKAKADVLRAETGNVVANALDDIDRLAASSSLPVAGAIGARIAGIPGTAAHDVSKALETVGANISFGQLQQMRESSPTGGALGAVTERELELLKNSYASLSQSQSADQFKTNLGRVRATFERIVHGRTLTATERKTGGPMTPERAQNLRDEAAKAIASGAPRNEVMKRLKQDYGITPEGL